MLKIVNQAFSLNADFSDLPGLLARRLNLPVNQIKSCRMLKKSIDARRETRFLCTFVAELEDEEQLLATGAVRGERYTPPKALSVPSAPPGLEPIVVGSGPAGMFCALTLARAGAKPLVIERGEDVQSRVASVERFWRTGQLDTESNVQFGEGGAGTFSDGKLTTGTKDARMRTVLETFAAFGAPESILYDGKPHVGTDRLRAVVAAMRAEFIRLGGQVVFRTRVTDFKIERGRITGVVAQDAQGEKTYEASHVFLAIGHSARDTFTRLHEKGVALEAKPFSMGVRIEHAQEWLDGIQYGPSGRAPGSVGTYKRHEALSPADYKLAVHLPGGRSVYTFCMCPGGAVVAAASEEGGVVTNGMSLYARDNANANSAVLVGVTPADYPGHPLAGMELQRIWERKAFEAAGGGYAAISQITGDFLRNKPSQSLGTIKPTYLPGVTLGNVRECLPEYVTAALAQALPLMGRKLKGFDHPHSLLTGPETRSSSPVRILRGTNMQAVNVIGLYPCGEGAGYAGGIVSAAVDGIRAAEAALYDLCPSEPEAMR